MRLIDADNLLTAFPPDENETFHTSAVRGTINACQTVDAVPLGVEMWEDRFNIQTRTWRTKDGETEAKSFIITRRKRKDGEHEAD